MSQHLKRRFCVTSKDVSDGVCRCHTQKSHGYWHLLALKTGTEDWHEKCTRIRQGKSSLSWIVDNAWDEPCIVWSRMIDPLCEDKGHEVAKKT